MKIVVVGVGKFGKALINMLKKENHNIIAIDNDKEVANFVSNEYNVISYFGNGASIDTLKDAGCENADLLVASTGSDEINILACALSKAIGIKYSIARIKDKEYSNQTDVMSNEFGITAFVNANNDTAKEIFRTLCFPGAIRVESFAKGKVDIAEIKITEDDELVLNKPIKDSKNKYNFESLVCAVKRDNEVIIPNGDFVLQANDYVYICGEPKELIRVFKTLKLYRSKVDSAIIIGASSITSKLVDLMDESGISATVVERDKDIALEFSNNNANCVVINGDGTNIDLLESEGLKNSAVISLTGIDETNIIVSTLAKKAGSPLVITKVSTESLDPILDSVGLDSIVSPKEVFALKVVRYIRAFENKKPSTACKSLYKLLDEMVEAIEFEVLSDTDYTNIPIKDLKIRSGYLIVSIIRNSKVIVPGGNDSILLNDRVVVVTTNDGTKDLSEIFK